MAKPIKSILVIASLAAVVGLDRAGVLSAAQADTVRGSAQIIDGDSIRVQGVEIRLHGIDAPEGRQLCQNAQGQDYRCGDVARDALKSMTRGLDVECNRLDVDRYGRWVSECRTEQTILNEQMVMQGHAVAYRRYSQAYIDAEEQARAEKRGIWAGRFEKPERWRRNNR